MKTNIEKGDRFLTEEFSEVLFFFTQKRTDTYTNHGQVEKQVLSNKKVSINYY